MDIINLKEKYLEFLNLLDKKIHEDIFKKSLEKAQEIDIKYYEKKITIEKIYEIIQSYKEREIENNLANNIQTILPGNPEIVFCLAIETFRNNVNMIINIEDFCVGQNMFLIEFVNDIFSKIKFNRKIELKNQSGYDEIINVSKNVDKTICIGNSNDYNRLEEKIDNLFFYPYNIFEIYCISEEMNDLKRMICDYAYQNEYEIDIYDDLNIDDAITAINRDGYKFCSVILSKNEEEIEKFKKEILSDNIFVNENPFGKIKFELKIN